MVKCVFWVVSLETLLLLRNVDGPLSELFR